MKSYKYFLLFFLILSVMPALANPILRLTNGQGLTLNSDFIKIDQMSSKDIRLYVAQNGKVCVTHMDTSSFGKDLINTEEDIDEAFEETAKKSGTAWENVTKTKIKTKSGYPVQVITYDQRGSYGIAKYTMYTILINGRIDQITHSCTKDMEEQYSMLFFRLRAQITNL